MRTRKTVGSRGVGGGGLSSSYDGWWEEEEVEEEKEEEGRRCKSSEILSVERKIY
jgi:hypothetical protein